MSDETKRNKKYAMCEMLYYNNFCKIINMKFKILKTTKNINDEKFEYQMPIW